MSKTLELQKLSNKSNLIGSRVSKKSILIYASLVLIINVRFTYGERKNCPTIKNSQNIMNMIVCKIYFWFYFFIKRLLKTVIYLLDFTLSF